jgi:predicted DNA-binding transcriptional regulator YafY
MQRTQRLFALAEYLRGRRTGVTAEALAERFGVTVRTIYRDLDALREASMPLAAERGRGGGYALDRETTRDVRIEAVLMDRHETRIDAVDLASGERRHFRLDRIERAQVVS